MTAKRGSSKRPRRQANRRRTAHVHQFLVVLTDTDPLVWRRIQVPERYSFWDLHVAIQDAMGWLDYHLHEFTIPQPDTGRLETLGIPGEEHLGERACLPDWQVPITRYFTDGQPLAVYVYDFGDDWRHVVMYEGTWPADPSATYPRCLGGARACPPEDCGGAHRYAEFLAAIADAKHPEHAELLAWAGGQYDPDAFRPEAVAFDNPQTRWKQAFEK